MPSIRFDFISDANTLIGQIGDVVRRINELQRSAADVYAMRGDAGMIGLQRQIVAANAELTNLKTELRSLGSSGVDRSLIDSLQGIGREFNSARASAAAFRQEFKTLGSGMLAGADSYRDAGRGILTPGGGGSSPPPDYSANLFGASGASVAELIAGTVGLDRALKSASESARVLERGLYSASDADGVRRVTAAYNAESTAIRRTTQELSMQEKTARDAARVEELLFPKDPPTQRMASAFGKIEGAKNLKNDLAEVDGLLGKLAPSARHIVALFDEMMRGQRGAMTASVGALLRDQQAISGIISALVSPWGMVAAAGVGTAVAIGIAFEQMWQKQKAAEEVAVAALYEGGGTSPAEYKATEAEIGRVADKTHEWMGKVREVYEALSTLPLAAKGIREQLAEFAIGKAGPGGDIVEEAKKLAHGLGDTAESAAKFAEKAFNIKSATDGSNRSLVEQIAAVSSSREKWDILGAALEKNLGTITRTRLEVRETANSWSQWILNLGLSTAAMDGDGQAARQLYENLQKVHQPTRDLTEAGHAASQAELDLKNAMEVANEGIDKQIDKLTQLGLLLNQSANSAAMAAAQQNAIAQIDKSSGSPGEQNRHQIAMDNIDAEAQKRSQDTQAQIAAERARLTEIQRTQTQKYITAGKSPDEAAAFASGSEEVIKQQQRVDEAVRKGEDEKVQLAIAGQRAIIANEQIGTQARIAAQEQIIAMTKKEVDAGRAKAIDLANEEVKLATLKRQENTKSFQEARDNARAEVELAKGNVDQIIAAYQRLSGAAVKFGMPGTVQAQIGREMVRDLESAQQKMFSVATEYNSSQERLGNIQIAAEKARLAEQVAAHKMSKEDMARTEGDFTQKVMTENERRIENELSNNNLTQEQKAKLYEHLAELYEKDAELQIQAQEKATQAIEAENKRREAIFTKTFDQIGSEGEKAIEGMFDRSKTHGQVLAEAARNIFKDVAKSAGTELSEIGGQKLGPMLGLTKEESKGGIGQVLGDALFKGLGLEKTPDKDAKLSTAADKMQKAQDAQLKAAELQSKAAENLEKASAALNQYAGGRGVPQNFREGSTVFDPNNVGSNGVFSTTDQRRNYILAGAQARGLNVAGVDALVKSEGGYAGYDTTGDHGKSFGPFQDYTGGGLGNQMLAQGIDPRNPANEKQTIDWNLDYIQQHGASPDVWHGLRNTQFSQGFGPGNQTSVKLDPSSAQTVGQGVQQGNQESTQLFYTSMEDGVQAGNQALVQANLQDKTAIDASKVSLDKNTQSLDKNTNKVDTSGGGGSGSGSTGGSLNLLKDGANAASQGLNLLGGRFAVAGNILSRGIGAISQLTTITKDASSTFDLMGGASKAVTAATTLEQGAKTLNATATATDTTAMQTNAAAASASGGSGILGGLFKIFGFSGGGIVPSAAGGMVVPGGGGGTLSILHPQEMVLPAPLSKGLQGMINRGDQGGGGNSMVLNYNANVTGYHPFESKSAFESMLRNNSGSMMDFVRNEIRNGSYR